jgi:arylformamidase
VTGHSAGGHLAARMACADGPDGIARVVPISPLAELAPLMNTVMNKTLKIDASLCKSESPARLRRRSGIGAHVWVGADERPAFLWQARVLSESWDCPWTAEPGRHHFDVIAGLEDPDSGLTAVCLSSF